MAWNTIKRSCGHEERMQLYGKMVEREYQIKKEEKKLCLECWKKEHANDKPDAELVCNYMSGKQTQINITGNTFNVKEIIKEIGGRFSDSLCGQNDLVGLTPKKGWYIPVDEKNITEKIKLIQEKLNIKVYWKEDIEKAIGKMYGFMLKNKR